MTDSTASRPTNGRRFQITAPWGWRTYPAQDKILFVAKIEITKVTSKADLKTFIEFPWRIYQNDPAWVPPLLIERKEFLDREKHPFFEHGKAEFFLARRDGEIA